MGFSFTQRHFKSLNFFFFCAVALVALTPAEALVPAAAAAHAAASAAAAHAAVHAAGSSVAAHGVVGSATSAFAHMSLLGGHAFPSMVGYSIGASPLVTAIAVDGLSDATRLLALPPAPPSRAAVGRILLIEFERICSSIRQGGKPAHVIHRVKSTAEVRSPIIKWALNLWLQNALGTDTPGMWCPTLKKLRLHPWQRMASSTPGFRPSLRVLERELTEQMKFGLRTAPFLAVKLAYRSIVVAVVAIVGRWPGFQWMRSRLRKTWPRCVDALAATIEKNHAALVSSGLDSIEAVRQREREMRVGVNRRIAERVILLRCRVNGLCFRAKRALLS
ncbi:hypothetical protein AB1Y20_022487 [Prymnesium parvum]|uniref:Uncharacterized protein n=1 Tax=Prymnesium parvum TaxID=97485 RepID=A0AB34JJI9_PRYPA|mmetsp:Transcript_36278/g.90299  ORF Transcript_36278/g.90299 Transcript_36278/m.90299 type:complete len:333 (-) Transcript_36278:201-1199(-)